MRIRFDELHLVLMADPFYGAGSRQTVTTTEKNALGQDIEVTITKESPPEQQYPSTKILIAKIYSETAGHQLFQQFRRRWNSLSCKSDTARHLVYLWCGLMGLPTYWKDGSRTNWEREEFLDNWEVDEFFIELEELKNFLDKHKLPLPISLYPNAVYSSLMAFGDENNAFDIFQPLPDEPPPDEENHPIGFWNTVEDGRTCTGNEHGYLPLFTAIKLVTTGDADAKRLNADGLGLVSKARRENSKWDVRECWTRPITETVHFVHLGDFIKWAWDYGIHAPDDVIKTWLRESDSDEDSAVRLHILQRCPESITGTPLTWAVVDSRRAPARLICDNSV